MQQHVKILIKGDVRIPDEAPKHSYGVGVRIGCAYMRIVAASQQVIREPARDNDDGCSPLHIIIAIIVINIFVLMMIIMLIIHILIRLPRCTMRIGCAYMRIVAAPT